MMNYILSKMKHHLIHLKTKIVIEKLFWKNVFIQNLPNSPNLVFPIEYILAFIKPKIKRRNPQTLEELKKFTLEERKQFPKIIS